MTSTERMRLWRERNRDWWLAYSRIYKAQRRAADPEAARLADRARYARDGERIKERGREARAKRAAYIAAIKDRPCADCGQTFHFSAMEFDHLPGTDKAFNIGRGGTKVSLEELNQEIAKCEVVCANCHAIRTWQRRQP